jgi:hypothetical protein
MPRNVAAVVHAGEQYGRLTVLAEHAKGRRKRQERVYLCRCECGETKVIGSYNLRSGKTKSCGYVGARKIVARCSYRSPQKHRADDWRAA